MCVCAEVSIAKMIFNFYAVTIDEEFDFKAEDIITVTDMPLGGWWSRELVDEVQRQPGRHVFQVLDVSAV